jgi:hypothetical protein
MHQVYCFLECVALKSRSSALWRRVVLCCVVLCCCRIAMVQKQLGLLKGWYPTIRLHVVTTQKTST